MTLMKRIYTVMKNKGKLIMYNFSCFEFTNQTYNNLQNEVKCYIINEKVIFL